MLAIACALSAAYTAPLAAPRSALRASEPAMQLKSSVFISLDPYGEFKGQKKVQKPVKILSRVEELKVLSSLADAGVLSSAEEAGIFSKLERAGAFSTAEKLLPLADDLKLLSTAEYLLNVPSSYLFGIASLLLVGEAGLIFFVPDDGAALVAVQAISGAAVGLGAIVLIATSYLFSLIQGEN